MDLENLTVGITGAGGFIGMRLLREALDRGAEVRGLDASREAARRAEKEGAEVVVGDVRDAEAAEKLCRGCDVLVHTAAIVGEGGEIAHYRDVNVEGSRRVAAAAAEAGVRQMVHLSSVMVYGFHFPPEVDERGPLRGEGNAYCQTKIESEHAVRSYHGRGDLEVTVVRPGDVYGPGSVPWVVRPLELMKSHLFVLPDGGHGKLDPTYVDNLVDAIYMLVEKELTGETFNATDGLTLECREFFRYHADMLGKRSIPTAPAALLKPLFRSIAAGFRAVGLEPPATEGAVDFLTIQHGYSNEKIREAGHEPAVGLAEGMAEVERWARSTGLI